MSEQSLRAALEKVLATTDGWAVSNETLLGVLAAHPTEPTPVVTDGAAQKAAERAVFQARYGVDWDSTWLDEAKRDTARQNATATASVALEAAAPLLGPRPLLDQQAVANVVYTTVRAQAGPAAASLAGTDILGRLMEMARPMPTLGQIAEAIHGSDLHHLWATEVCSEACRERYLRKAAAVMALLNGAES